LAGDSVLKSALKEVTSALKDIGEPDRGEGAQNDKASSLKFLAIRVPVLRARVRDGSSFFDVNESARLAVFDYLWHVSPFYEVKAVPLYYLRLHPDALTIPAFRTIRKWIPNVDNWGHADAIAGVLAKLNRKHHEQIYPFLVRLNSAESVWAVRISIVALVDYTGKNSAYLGPKEVLPLLERHLSNQNKYVARSVGWVLREMRRAYPIEIERFVRARVEKISAEALSVSGLRSIGAR
jgi:hypothetical protein